MGENVNNRIKLSEVCGLSKDAVAGLPIISLIGDCEVYIENYRGILEYSSEHLKAATRIGNIRIYGKGLVIFHMNQDEILIKGAISRVSLKGEADEKNS